MKNKIYLIIDENNDVIVNSTISLSDEMAKNQIINNLKQSIYIFTNSTNLAEKAKILSYLTTAQDFALYTMNETKTTEIYNLEFLISYKEILKPYQKQLKLTKDEVKKEIKNDKNNN